MIRSLWFHVSPRHCPSVGELRALLVVVALGVAAPAAAQVPVEDVRSVADAAPVPESALGALLAERTRGLDETQVVAEAVASAPSIEAARAAVDAARAGARRALLGFVPEVQVGFRYTRISNIQNGSIGAGVDNPALDAAINGVSDPNARLVFRGLLDGLTNTSFPILRNQYAFTASVSYPLTDLFLTVLPRMRASDATLDAQRVQADVERRSVALQAREAFYEHIRAKAALRVAQDGLAQAEAHRDRVAVLVREGAAAPVDLMRVEAGVAAAQVAIAQAEMGVALTLEVLQSLTHHDGPLEVRFAAAGGSTPPAGSLVELQALAERERPELLAFASLRDARGHQLRAAQGAQYPRVAVQANFVYANPNPRVFPQRAEFTPAWDVSAVLSWSLQQTLDARQQAASAEAELARLDADVQRVRDGVRLEVASAFHQLNAAEHAVEAAQALVRASDEAYRLRWVQLEAGTVMQSDVVDARLERVQAHVELLNAEVGEQLARVRLRHAVSGVTEADAALGR